MQHELTSVRDKQRLYLAGPLFSTMEQTFNVTVKQLLRPCFEVYLPQEDGGLMVRMIANGMTHREAAQAVFEMDIKALRDCDLLLIIMDGRAIDEGASFELGYAYAHGKRCYGLQTDVRRLVKGGNNPMIDCALLRVFASTDELMDWAHNEYVSSVVGVP